MTVQQIGVIGLRGPDGNVYETVPIYAQVPEDKTTKEEKK